MKKKVLIIVGIIVAILVVAGLVTSYADSARVRNGVEPKHVIKIVSEDGNKVTYWGLGYKVVLYPSVSPNEPYKNNRGVKYGSWFMKYELETDVNVSLEEVNNFINEYFSKEEAGKIADLSKLPENSSETLRLVFVGDYDICPCIGDHVANTSEIGTFKIISADFADGKLRLRWKVLPRE